MKEFHKLRFNYIAENSVMTTNENQEKNETGISDARVLIDRLKQILLDKKSLGTKEKDEAERLVALCSIQFQKENNEDLAFELMAIIGVAKSKGLKQARTRTINLSRWLHNSPPSIVLLKTQEEQVAAIQSLSSIKFSWSAEYIMRALTQHVQADPVNLALFQWGKKSSHSIEYFIEAIYTPFFSSVTDLETAIKYLKTTNKLLSPLVTAHPNKIAIALNNLSQTLVDLLQVTLKSEKKREVLALSLTLGVFTECWHQIPPLLLQPNFISGFSKVITALNQRKKIPASKFSQIETATLNTLSDCIARAPDSSLSTFHASRPLWESTFPNYSKLLKIASRDDQNLKAFIEYIPGALNQQAPSTDSAESTFTELLLAWNAQVKETADQQGLEHLTSLIFRAAKHSNIESFGVIGTTVPFDPIWHTLSSQVLAIPKSVSILTPGVLVYRSDGTKRVLVPAFTVPA